MNDPRPEPAATGQASDPHRQSMEDYRRKVLLYFLPFLSTNLLLGFAVMREIPDAYPFESLLPLLYGLLVAGCFFWLWRRPGALLPVGALVAVIIILFFLGRIVSLVSGPAVNDPRLPLFMPLYAYLPFAYFSMYVLLPVRRARAFSILFWVATALVVLGFLVPEWERLAGRYGGTSLLLYLLVANPMFIVMLELIGRMDRQLSRTLGHLIGYRRELELRRQIERLGERFKLAVMGSRDGLWEWPDTQQPGMWWSERTFELLKLDPTRTRASTQEIMRRTHPDDATDMNARLRQAGEHLDEDIQLEIRLMRGDGLYQWFLLRAVSVPGSQSVQTRMAGSLRNIHQQKEAELELRRSNETLNQFARVAAHDLRSPLNRITMTAGLVRRKRPELEADPDTARLLDMVDRQAKYMSELIDSLLEFARQGEAAPPVPVDLDTVLGQVLEMLQPDIEQRGATVTAGPLPVVVATEVEMTRIFQNLIGNALKFCELAPVIRIEGERQGAFAEIRIRDNGIGIPPDRQEEVLQPLGRLHSRDEYPGHGLGLAEVNNIVHRRGGRLRIESRAGQGTTFHLTLLTPVPDTPETG